MFAKKRFLKNGKILMDKKKKIIEAKNLTSTSSKCNQAFCKKKKYKSTKETLSYETWKRDWVSGMCVGGKVWHVFGPVKIRPPFAWD